jgi:glyoxylase I family protein
MGDLAVTGFHHVALTVRNIVTSAAWYENLFDLEPLFDEPGDERHGKVYRLRGTSALLGLVQHSGNDGSVFRPDRTGLDHAAFAVPTRRDIEAWAARLDEAGIEHSGVISIPTGAILNFSDPDLVALSIFWDAG